MPTPSTETRLHASAVAAGTTGLLIRGASGSGKSTLAIAMMALGARLVADDQVICRLVDGAIQLSAPAPLEHKIEARGIGILPAQSAPAVARYVVDLDHTETARLPEPRETVIMKKPLPLLHRVESPAFPAMLWLLLQGKNM